MLREVLIIFFMCFFSSVQTSSTGSMQVESSDTSLTSNTDMHDIVEKYVSMSSTGYRTHEINVFFRFLLVDLMIMISPSTIYFYFAIYFIYRLSMDHVHCRLSMNSTG